MKKCTGCDRLDNEPLGLNNKGNKYLACCPDNNYVEISVVKWFAEELYKKIEMKGDGKVFDELLEQANQMVKQEKHAEYMRGWKDGYSCKSIKTKMK